MPRAKKQAPTIETLPAGLLPEAEPMAVQDIGDSLVIREWEIFLLTDEAGQVVRGNRSGFGLYHQDTRYLSGYELNFSNARPLLLLSTAELGYSSEQVMTNPLMVDAAGRHVPRGTIHIQRTRVVDDVVEERFHVHNHNPFPVTVGVQYRLAADFADIFEVRGWEAEVRGEVKPPFYEGDRVTMSADCVDGTVRQTSIAFSPAPDSLAGDEDLTIASYEIELGSQEGREIFVSISLDAREEPPCDLRRMAVVAERRSDWLQETAHVRSGNDFFDAVLTRSLADIRMLWTMESGMSFPAAGTPWYDALFGRDSCIVGMQTLAFRPEIARDVLRALASLQGTKYDSWRDEEPGKIPHELRRGELTLSGELPFAPYYGSIDSTPLFLMLAGEYFRWTGDLEFMRELMPNIEAGVHWLHAYGDTNGDGFIDYEKRSVKGLVNQGWKDSVDSIVHRDGSLAEPPITLVEVQAYAYAALTRLGPVFEALGAGESAARWRAEAAKLRDRFSRDFWMADEGCYALALDGRGARVASVTSNAGHVLWCGAADADQARVVGQRLLQKDMFSGWGIRTLSHHSPRYNPQGYHLGTIWPHDNSIVAMGFKRYGLPQLGTLATAIFEAAKAFQYYRLPELFGGSPTTPHQTPVPYPVACRPQAWAAGAMPLVTQAMLGLCPDAPNKRLYVVAPELPAFLEEVTVSALRVGDAEVDLSFRRSGQHTYVMVKDVRGQLEVREALEWPAELM